MKALEIKNAELKIKNDGMRGNAERRSAKYLKNVETGKTTREGSARGGTPFKHEITQNNAE